MLLLREVREFVHAAANFIVVIHELKRLAHSRTHRLAQLDAGARLFLGRFQRGHRTARFEELIALLSRTYERVYIDTPPVLAATDAVVVSASADAMVFVVGSGTTRRRIAQRALETLLVNAPQRVCTVLNRVNVARHRYYYARRYGARS